MGVNLIIFSNHKIRNNSFEEKLHQIESLLKIKIEDKSLSSWKTANLPEKTSIKDDIVFYINKERAKLNYQISDELEIEIFLNYKFLFSIRIFGKTMKINPSGFSNRWEKWLYFLGDEDAKKTKYHDYMEYNKKWRVFQKYQFQIVEKLGGNKLVYFGDHNFQEPEDLFYQGKDLDEIIPELEKIGKLFEIKMLYENYKFIFYNDEVTNYGFYEEINNNI